VKVSEAELETVKDAVNVSSWEIVGEAIDPDVLRLKLTVMAGVSVTGSDMESVNDSDAVGLSESDSVADVV
jgi:hypothetical protein